MNAANSKQRYYWRPLSFAHLLGGLKSDQKKGIFLILIWGMLTCLSLVSIKFLMPLQWLASSGNELAITRYFIINPPLIIGLLLVFWVGFEWGVVPVFISSYVLAYLAGMNIIWSVIFGLSFIFGLTLFGLAYQSLCMPHDLRDFKSIVFFVAVAFIASLASSIGAFIWSLSQHLSAVSTAIIWKSWWTGVFFQFILITGPLLFLFTPVVENTKIKNFQLPEARDISLKWIYGTIITITAVLILFIFSAQMLGRLRINEVLNGLPNIVRGDVTGALGTFEIIIWLSMGLITITGYAAMYLVAKWNKDLQATVDERTKQYEETEQKLQKSLTEKKLMLKETHHRVKNNLAHVQALLQLQMLNIDDAKYTRLMEDSTTRIHSMSLIHQALYETEEYSHISLDKYFHKLSNIIHRSFKRNGSSITLNFQLDKHKVTTKQAVPLGLILTEILINAYKYAFDGREQGTISIALQQQQQQLLLTICDDGIGISDEALQKNNSLGMELMRKFSEQIDADFTLHNKDEGTRFTLLFKPAVN